MITIKAQLVAKENDLLDYTTYVFKCLENNIPFGHHYCMMTRCQNWNHRDIDVGEIGYVEYEEVKAGDTWFNPQTNTYVPYNYTNIYFIKFVKEKDNSHKDILL